MHKYLVYVSWKMGKSKLSDLPRSQEYSDKKTLQSIFPAHFCSAADGIFILSVVVMFISFIGR